MMGWKKVFLDSISEEIEKEINNLILSDDFFIWRFVDKKVLKNEKEIERVLDSGCFDYEGFYISVGRRLYVKIPLGKIGEDLEKNDFLRLLRLKKDAKKEAIILMNAFIYLDILGVCDVNDSQNVNYIKGKSLGPYKQFMAICIFIFNN